MSIKDKDSFITDIGLVSAEDIRFFKSKNGFLGVDYKGTEYKRIILSRSMPYSEPESYICISDNDMKEIGILESISLLSPEQAEMVREELRKRYFNPIIKEVLSAKMKLGYVYFDTILTTGKKIFTVKDFSRNIRQLDGNRLIITDVDGNRYLIEDLFALDSKSRTRLAPYLF